MNLIPKKLSSNYIIHNETMKYSTFDDEEFEKNITDENITEKILITNLNNLDFTMDTFIEKFLILIKNDKLGINEYLKKFNLKTLEYILVSKVFKLILKELKIKLNDENTKEDNIEEYNFDDFIKE